MRGIPSLITDIRKRVFTEIARMAYEGGDYTRAEDLPYVIVPGDKALHRESIFLERAIAGERVRLAMGLSIRSIQTRTLMPEGMDQAAIAESYYEPPLINIIPYACHACPSKQYTVTQFCQNCLAASCQKVLGGWANIANEYATKRYRSNLINWGMLPLLIQEGELPFHNLDYLFLPGIRRAVEEGAGTIEAFVVGKEGLKPFELHMGELTPEERQIILKGCLINYNRAE